MTVVLTVTELVLAALLALAVVIIVRRRRQVRDPGAVEAFNTQVRSMVTLALTSGFIWGFVIKEAIDAAVFVTMFSMVLGFWFGTRDSKSRATDGHTTSVTTEDTNVVTGPGAAAMTRRKGEHQWSGLRRSPSSSPSRPAARRSARPRTSTRT